MSTVIDIDGLYISDIVCVDENTLNITLRPYNTVGGTRTFQLPRVEYGIGFPPPRYEFEILNNGIHQTLVVRPSPEIMGHDQTLTLFDVHIPQRISLSGVYVFDIIRRRSEWVRNVRPRLVVSNDGVGRGQSRRRDEFEGNQIVNNQSILNEVIIPVVEDPPQIIYNGFSEEEITLILNPSKYCPNNLSEAGLCCICQEEYISDQDINVLKCNHVFHLGCIKTWLKHNKLCPMCRKNVMEE